MLLLTAERRPRPYLITDVFAWPNVDWSDLKPYQDFKHKHEFFYQVQRGTAESLA